MDYWASHISDYCGLLRMVDQWPLWITEHCRSVTIVDYWALQVSDHCGLLNTADQWPLWITEHCRSVTIVDYWALQISDHCGLLSIADQWLLWITEHCISVTIVDYWSLQISDNCGLLNIADRDYFGSMAILCWPLLINGHIFVVKKWWKRFTRFCLIHDHLTQCGWCCCVPCRHNVCCNQEISLRFICKDYKWSSWLNSGAFITEANHIHNFWDVEPKSKLHEKKVEFSDTLWR